jgi:hypothetical protein
MTPLVVERDQATLSAAETISCTARDAAEIAARFGGKILAWG